MVPVAGFLYLIFYPRFTWLKGSIGLVSHIFKKKIAQPDLSIKALAAEFKTPYWNSAKEYWHMCWNNVVMLSAWVLMCMCIGTALFVTVYAISVSLAGAAGIVIFTVQHNFEHSYANENEDWDYDAAVMHGTSFLVLPRWLNWFTVNIAYHHIHHLSAKIPNYCLVKCHDDHQELFRDVKCLNLFHLPKAFKFILWDTRSHHLISVAELNIERTRPA